jgi:superfamily II DNA helicase RecQ
LPHVFRRKEGIRCAGKNLPIIASCNQSFVYISECWLAFVSHKVVQRIHRILKDYEDCKKQKAKSLCFCLSPGKCETMAGLLEERGLSTEVLHGQSNEEGLTPDIISRFKKGETQVLCAPKGELLTRSCLSALDCSSVLTNSSALGRGFHDLDIRFIFHAVVPLSLRD